MAGYIIFFGLLLVLFFLISHTKGNPGFWKATRKYPGLAWTFFNSHPAWYLNIKPQYMKVAGPFYVKNPLTEEVVKLYCDEDQLVSSQNFFMQMIHEIK